MLRSIIIVVTLLLFAACSRGETVEPTVTVTATSSTDAPTGRPPTEPEPGPAELANRILEASAGTDPEAWRALLHPDSPVFSEIPWDRLEDFDGDGVASYADWKQSAIALHRAERARGEWTCTPVSEDTAECTWVLADAFHALAGVEPTTMEVRWTFADGYVVAEEMIPLGDPGPAEEARYEEIERYEEWVAAEHPETYPEIFAEPRCGDWVTLPSAIPVHEELMPAYFETAASR